MTWINLDHCCAVAATEALKQVGHDRDANKAKRECKKAESAVNEAMTCLMLQGPYAMACYLQKQASANRPGAKGLIDQSLRLLKSHVPVNPVQQRLEGHLKYIATDLGRLLLARKLLTQVLIYARYELKGRPQ